MKKILLVLLSVGMLLQAQAFQSKEKHKPDPEDFKVLKNATHFYVIGDWGRNGYMNQQEVADMMQEMAYIIEPDFIISTGDNFYPNGIASVEDPYWISSYENIYKGNYLFENWYITLGNHDYRGNVQAQIDYTYRSRRWNLPERYYSMDMLLEDDSTEARFVFLDTSPLNDGYYSLEKYADAVKGQDTTRQIKWLDKTLSADKKDWTIVIGHHPFYTGGKRKADFSYVRGHLEKYFDKYKVDAYFAGHEHDLQHLKPKNKKTHHFISGAGSEALPVDEIEISRFAESSPGFMVVSLSKSKMLVQLVNHKGKLIYSYSKKKK